MKDHNEHIDQQIREKMETFEVTPPAHVWQGVVSGLESHHAAKANTTKKIIIWTAAAALLLSLLGWLILSPSNGIWADNTIQHHNTFAHDIQKNEIITLAIAEEELIQEEPVIIKQTVVESTPEFIDIESTKQVSDVSEIYETDQNINGYEKTIADEVVVESKDSQLFESRSIYNITFLRFADYSQLNLHTTEPSLLYRSFGQSSKMYNGTDLLKSANDTRIKGQSRWSAYVGVSSEFVSSTYDSVTILNTYALGIEPIYHFNKHWFVRFGIGVSSSRDRGFAKLDYISNEYMGSYDDVYDVTFDSINDQVVPTYHTKTVEVWDSIRHLVVSEVTNRYAYAQLPLMFGYYHPASKAGINWYVFGGPTFNFQIGKWIDDPHPAESYIEILDLQNKLPERNDFYMQLSLNVGIEYKMTDKISMAVEPGYRYYVNSIYNKEGYNKSLSAFSLRVGAIIRLK